MKRRLYSFLALGIAVGFWACLWEGLIHWKIPISNTVWVSTTAKG